MGMWIELGIFVLVLVFGLWQIQDVKKERRKREALKQAEAAKSQTAHRPGVTDQAADSNP